jgi:hypothetical protein
MSVSGIVENVENPYGSGMVLNIPPRDCFHAFTSDCSCAGLLTQHSSLVICPLLSFDVSLAVAPVHRVRAID